MTTMAMTLPLDRVSPVRVPIRDLVLDGTDSVTLLVSIIDRDSSDALPIALTGGIGGPAISMFVWPAGRWCGGWGGDHDYGWGGWHNGGVAGPGTALWTGFGSVYDMATATFRVVVPAGTVGAWPRRCRWAIYFDADGGGEAELLAEGHLHVRPMLSRAIAPLILLTDPNPAALTDGSEAIYLAGGPGVAAPTSGGSGGSGYVLPIATPSTLGGIKTDGTHTVTNASGVLSVIATLG